MTMRGAACAALAALLFSSIPLSAAGPQESALLCDSELPGPLLSGIRGARHSIIGAYYLFNTGRGGRNVPSAVTRELIAAARRGVAVTILLEGKKPVGAENRRTGIALARGGVKVLFPAGKGAVHLKALVIDDRLLFLGSHNLTQAALTRNRELSLSVADRDLAIQTRRYLERLAERASYLAVGRR